MSVKTIMKYIGVASLTAGANLLGYYEGVQDTIRIHKTDMETIKNFINSNKELKSSATCLYAIVSGHGKCDLDFRNKK